ncbi:alkaline phosphatase [Candidatus Beckwithbacteria bacterium CG10_big_fil_rev_8_21_14_0_10_34_10]|uniref:Alkaline phosphatase n=1 Tax=Candidatus Beckwithbacteria bacterium CG10_big_fil_rev_8_21_14_0_10_34_10 TaxID=1974495 RepID=A0A2H0WAP7_9BACT|nr:MAG: alkaline phosphatase [Candidatus Beckwithbacteria bacterium CG10_big_fil_rev_8_21_14_0_10_34_10]
MIESIIQPLADFVIFLVNKLSYGGVVLAMAIESCCIPLPSEIIMPFAGFMVSKGVFNFWLVALAGGLGCLIGSMLAYAIGYFGGETLVRNIIKKYGKYVLVFEYELDEAEVWFRKHGEMIAFSSRLLPVVRTFISLPAGISKMNFKKFCFYTLTGSIIWSAVLGYIGKVLGENWNSLGTYFHKFDLAIVLSFFGLGVFYVDHKLKKHKKRKSQ